MSRTSALGAVFALVSAELLADGEGTAVVFGKREPAKNINQGSGRANRVIFEPVSGQQVGTFDAPRFPGGNPKAVSTFLTAATVYLWAVDSTHINDELAQYEAITALQERVVRALYHACDGAFLLGPIKDVASKTERVFGNEWAFTFTVREGIFDVAETSVSDVLDDATIVLDSPGV